MGRNDFRGFEAELVAGISEAFRFQDLDLRAYKLLPGRNLFHQDMPDVTAAGVAGPTGAIAFDASKEPAIAFYRQPASRPRPSASHGGTLEISELVVLRSPKTFQKALDLLDELDDYLEEEYGAIVMPGFKIGSVEIAGAATPFSRGADGASFASSTLRILAVSIRR